jgi:hypothetical protein
MSVTLSKVYEFVYRGHLAEEALDREGRQNCRLIKFADEEIARALSLDVLDDLLVVNARATAIVYAAIAAFENSVRALVVNTLMEKFQEEWWEKGVSHSIRERGQKRMEDEQIAKWHTQRGQDPINYTTFGDLKNIMHNNWDAFEDLVGLSRMGVQYLRRHRAFEERNHAQRNVGARGYRTSRSQYS